MTKPRSLSKRSIHRAFSIPELAQSFLQHLDQKTLRVLRLVSRSFEEYCTNYLFIILRTEKSSFYHKLHGLAESDKLHLIKSFHLSEYGTCYFNPYDQGEEESDSTSRRMEVHLNRCFHLREIHISEQSQGWYYNDIASHPARLTWSVDRKDDDNRMTQAAKQQRLCNWSELLPLEGSLLSRLETLSIEFREVLPMDCNAFMTRLSQSVVSQTLKVFSFSGISTGHKRPPKLSWEAFHNCMVSMKNLQELSLKYVESVNTASPSPMFYPAANTLTPLNAIAGTVKRLTIDTVVKESKIKLAILALFPNVEHLYTSRFAFCDAQLDEQLFMRKEGGDNVHSLPDKATSASISPLYIDGHLAPFPPFPRLVSLDVANLSVNLLNESQLFRHWILDRNIEPEEGFFVRHHETIGLARFLSRRSVALRRIHITQQGIELLSMAFCNALEELKLTGEFGYRQFGYQRNRVQNDHNIINGMEVILSVLFDKWSPWALLEVAPRVPTTTTMSWTWENNPEISHPAYLLPPHIPEISPLIHPGPPPPMLTRTLVLENLPWTRTLTKLQLSTCKWFYYGGCHVLGLERVFAFVLQQMHRLVDFEIKSSLDNLLIFEGLGHGYSQNSAAPLAPLCSRPAWFEDTDYPHLERLLISQSNNVDDDRVQRKWEIQLQNQFRYLKYLTVSRGIDVSQLVRTREW